MATDGVTITGQQAVDALLRQLKPENFVKIINRAAFKIGEQLRSLMSVRRYPGRPSYPLKWASAKQRRWYFWMRKQTGAGLPYERLVDPQSDQLGQSWQISPRADGVVVGTAVPYGPQVQSQELQTEMHKATGWPTDVEAVQELEANGVIGREIEIAVAATLKALGGV